MTGLGDEEDAVYRALGLYFVRFSGVVWTMRRSLGAALEAPDHHPMLVDTLFSDMQAASIARAFFAACLRMAELDDSEKETLKGLARIARETIEERNEYAHGDWMFGRDRFDPGAPLDLRLVRFHMTSGGGPELKVLTAKLIETRGDALQRLNEVLGEVADICIPAVATAHMFGGRRLRDFFEKDGSKIVRPGSTELLIEPPPKL